MGSSRPPTHTLPELEELLPAAIRNPPLPTDQSLLPSKPIKWPSNLTLPVSSPPDAELNSITVSSPSDTEPLTDKTSSSARTPGDQAGEMPVTLESEPPTTSAVSSTLPPTHPHEMLEGCIIPNQHPIKLTILKI